MMDWIAALIVGIVAGLMVTSFNGPHWAGLMTTVIVANVVWTGRKQS